MTNPLLDQEYYFYDASGKYDPYRHISYNGHKTSHYFIPGGRQELKARTVFANADTVTYRYNSKNLLEGMYDERGNWSGLGYNNQGRVTGVSKPHTPGTNNPPWTGIEYANNGLDVVGVTNANRVRTMSATYDASRQSNAKYQPETVTDLSVSSSGANGTSVFTYTGWGDPETAIDPQGRGTRYVYGTAGNELRRLVEVQNSDAPATPNGPRNWVTVRGRK